MPQSIKPYEFRPIDKPATPLASTMTAVRLPQHIHNLIASKFKSGYEKSAWLREVIEAAAIARWPEDFTAPEPAPEPEPKPQKFELTISNMPARGKKGWVRQGEKFFHPDSQSSYGASAQKLTFLLENGIYQVQDANFGSSLTRNYWLKVEGEEAIEIEEPKEDLEIDFPELEGSENQVAWAEKIREKIVKKLLAKSPQETLHLTKICFEETPSYKAAWWIEKEKSGFIEKDLSAWLTKSFKEKIKPYPVEDWEPYEAEYAHEGYGGDWHWKIKDFKYEVFKGKGTDLSYHVFCKNLESNKWEVWHYEPNFF
jgi:hypothetical protein